jgi:hypothetical protein
VKGFTHQLEKRGSFPVRLPFSSEALCGVNQGAVLFRMPTPSSPFRLPRLCSALPRALLFLAGCWPLGAVAGLRNAARNDAVWAAVFWTPQLLWAVLAAGLLVAVLVGFWRRRAVWWLMWLPYGMVVAALGVLVTAFGTGRGEYGSTAQVVQDPLFVETATPSLWALPGLGLLHTVVVGLLLATWYRQPVEPCEA